MSTTIISDSPRIYVGTYHKYASGSIYGEWVDLTAFADYSEFVTYCQKLHKSEYDPEFMIQDFENFPNFFYQESGLPSEETFNAIREYAEMDNKEEFEAFLSLREYSLSDDWDEIKSDFEDQKQGEFESENDFAYHYVESGCLGAIPKHLANYIDYDAVARDLFINGYTFYDGFVFADH